MKYVYFIGIGGIGMSAIARYYNHTGYCVSGYDRTPSSLTDALVEEGIQVHYQDTPEMIPREVDLTLVIYTPAIPEDLGELRYVREHGYRLVKRSRALGEIASDHDCLAVAGTHGKTTTSTLLAHLFTCTGGGCTAFLGGISKNYETNLLLDRGNILVAEADEFDRSFLQLSPHTAVITAMDADHLDIYGDITHVREAFIAFGSQVKNTLIVKKGLESHFEGKGISARIMTYSYDDREADFHAEGLTLEEGGHISFTAVTPYGRIEGCRMGIPGWVNVENGMAATAVALSYGLDRELIRDALKSFTGVKRRMDIHINTPECVYIDDYAHHPAELAATISSVRNIFPGRKITGIFQPHLFTRTRDFKDEFAASLSTLDELILLPIYPAREEPIEGVTSDIILNAVTAPVKMLIEKESITNVLSSRESDIVISFGAGDIDRLCPEIEQTLRNKYKL